MGYPEHRVKLVKTPVTPYPQKASISISYHFIKTDLIPNSQLFVFWSGIK